MSGKNTYLNKSRGKKSKIQKDLQVDFFCYGLILHFKEFKVFMVWIHLISKHSKQLSSPGDRDNDTKDGLDDTQGQVKYMCLELKEEVRARNMNLGMINTFLLMVIANCQQSLETAKLGFWAYGRLSWPH